MENKGLSYKEYTQGRRFLVKILPGESLVGRIADLIQVEKIQAAVVLSAIGSVKNVKLKDIKSGAKLPITPARLTPPAARTTPATTMGARASPIPSSRGSIPRSPERRRASIPPTLAASVAMRAMTSSSMQPPAKPI